MKLGFLGHSQPEESARSVLIRTAYKNAFGSVSAMARHFGSKDSLQPFSWQMQHSKLIQHLGEDLELNGSAFKSSFYTQVSQRTSESPVMLMGVQLPAACIRSDEYNFCPECLEEGMHRYIQDMKWVESCPYHQVKYASACPACDSSIRWTQLIGNNCGCGYDLRLATCAPSKLKASSILLKLFRAADQAAINRFVFALRALRYSGATNERSSITETAAEIADCNAATLDALIQASIERYPCLPIRAHLAVWMTTDDEWIQSQVKRLLSYPTHSAAHHDTCNCSQLELYQDEMQLALEVSTKRFRRLLKLNYINRSATRNLGWPYFSPLLCRLLSDSDTKILQSNSALASVAPKAEPDQYFTVGKTALKLGVYPDAVRSAFSKGFMSEQSIIGSKGERLLHEAAITFFSEHYVFVGKLAEDLGLSRTTLSAKLLHFRVQPISGPSRDGCLVPIYSREDLSPKILRQVREIELYATRAGRKSKEFPKVDATASISTRNTASALGIPLQRLKYLHALGHLEIAADNRVGTRYTSNSVANAQIWLQSMTTLTELSKTVSLAPQTFSRRFIQSGFIQAVKLGTITLIERSMLGRVQHHIENFLTCGEADSALNAPIGYTVNMVRMGRLSVIQDFEDGFVSTVRLLRRSDINKLIS